MKNKLLIVLLLVSASCFGQNLVPKPGRIDNREGAFRIDRMTGVISPGFAELDVYLNDHIERACGFRPGREGARRISIEMAQGLPSEGYTLDISPLQITLRASDRAGAFYGLQTLLQLMPVEVYDTLGRKTAETVEVPCCRIEDSPRFAYRGVMLDVSRTFFDKETVMRYIDWMARHKLNRLHWHLTDDNGWRIEIKRYPELTACGAWRGPGEVLPPSYGSGEKRYGGFYTQDDIREIVRYASFRNVEIIPEIDLPGHSQTATSVYPETFCGNDSGSEYAPEEMRNVLCAAREENFDMLRGIIHEIAALFPSECIHIGGDEVSLKYWKNCPRCRALMRSKGMKSASELQDYFIGRLEEIVHGEGKICGAWNEAMQHGTLDRSTVVYGWKDTEACAQAVRKGYPTVMMPASYCYIDMKQHPWDRGHTWAWLVDARRVYDFDPADTGIGAEGLKNVRGVEAAQWAELLDRPERFVEYQGYPRICALAEMGWTKRELRNWDDFYARLTGGHLDRLGSMGIRFRMFPPEVRYADGTITAQETTPRSEIRYTSDMSEPTSESPLYGAPIRTQHPERYRFRAFYRGGISTAVEPVAASLDLRLAPGEQKTVAIPLNEYVDRDGIWLLSLAQRGDDATIVRMEVSGPDTTYAIIRNGQKVSPFNDLRLYIDARNRTASVNITLRNNATRPDELTLKLRPSAYIEPPVRVTSSLSCTKKSPITNSSDYHFGTYVRVPSPCKAGDYILFTFDSPVTCEAIDIRTGIPNITRYVVTKGRVEYSADGRTFVPACTLDESGCAVLRPEGPVKAVRIAVLGSNGETTVCWQDLRVIPRLR